jgi:hypothetical protein
LKLFTLLMAGCLLMSVPVKAEIYKWTDENGRVHYEDKPRGNNSNKIKYKVAPIKNSKANSINNPTQPAEQTANQMQQNRYRKDREKRQKAEEKRKKEYRKYCAYARSDESRLRRELDELDKEQFRKRTVERYEIIQQKRAELSKASSDRMRYCRY